MNKIVITIFLSFFILVSSCNLLKNSNKIENDIVGKWKIENADLSNLEELVVELAESFGLGEAEIEEMKKEMQEDMSNEFIGSTIEFVEDHTFKSPDSEGKWTYNKEENKIEIEENGAKYDLIVDKLIGNTLDLTMVFSENEMEFKFTMSLSRQ